MFRYCRIFPLLLVGCVLTLSPANQALAQGVGVSDPSANQRIERVIVELDNPRSDPAFNDRIVDGVRSRLELFPGQRFSEQRLQMQMSLARRVRGVSDLDYDVSFGQQGGLVLKVLVSVVEVDSSEAPETGTEDRFPVLYDKNGTFLRFKLDLLSLYYANNDAWYGEPAPLLAGNPLVNGTPAGEGYEDWIEAYAHYGLYGITPISDRLYFYAGVSGLVAHSRGQELFTDQTRTRNGVEDAYLGLVGGRTDDEGNRFVYTLTAGRQRFTLANGFLIANTAANGQDRAALQSNARWAADRLILGRIRYNSTLLELFHLDPDELPAIDSKSTYRGLNLEFDPIPDLTVGISYLTAPRSSFRYFGPDGRPIGEREGLRVYDARFNYVPRGIGSPGPFLGAELARQSNRNFDMKAKAGWFELGYAFTRSAWSPSLSYRYARFSGDDPDTSTYERWDPILSGGTGEQWVQGANHFKVVQDSNVIAHRLQLRLLPRPTIELLPQFWIFRADSTANVGGNPALSFLADEAYGREVNITVKWFASRNLYVHGHLAYTQPGKAVELALEDDADDWFSLMAFVRYAF